MAQAIAQDRGITLNSDKIGHPNSKSEWDYETVALFRTSEHRKRVGLRDCCTFSYSRTAKASGITRLLHFFVLPNSKSERDYETVAPFRTSEQQKRAGLRDCCTFSYIRTAKANENTRRCKQFEAIETYKIPRKFAVKTQSLAHRMQTHSLSLTLSLSHSYYLSLSLSLSHSLPSLVSLSLTFALSFSFSFFLSFSSRSSVCFSFSHSLSLSLCFSLSLCLFLSSYRNLKTCRCNNDHRCSDVIV